MQVSNFLPLSALAASLLCTSVACSKESSGQSQTLDSHGELDEVAKDARAVTQCHGTEPFWGLSISREEISFTGIFDSELQRSMKEITLHSAAGRQEEYLAMYHGPTVEDESQTMNVIVKTEACTDGMSDQVYDYSAVVLLGSQVFVGCCSR